MRRRAAHGVLGRIRLGTAGKSARLRRWVLAAALLAACQPAATGPVPSSSPTGQVHRDLRVRLAYAPRTLDPALATSEVETGIIRQVWEPLLKPSPGLGGLEPAAAEAWQVSPDGLTYTFRLRAAARYSDGEPVRAQDFVYAWRRIIDPRIASPVADLLAVVVKGGEQAEALDPIIDVLRLEPALAGLGLAAPDERTFVLTLPRPAAQTPWIASLVQGVPLRRDLVEKSKDWWNQPAGLVGNGAFRAAAIEPAIHVDLLAEGRYWAGRPALDGISFQVLSDEAEALSRYDAGRLDIAELNAADPGRRANHLSQLELTAHCGRRQIARSLALHGRDDRIVAQQCVVAGRKLATLDRDPTPGEAPGVALRGVDGNDK